jgi:polyisoprenoid-binding protein YceI
VTGIDTNNADRDAHLKNADFLNVEAYPTIEFVTTSITSEDGVAYTFTGNLTISGQTHPITVEAEAVPPVTDPWGNYRAGMTGSGSIKRSEFGITYNSVMETGHVMISDEVKFTFDIQATLVKE